MMMMALYKHFTYLHILVVSILIDVWRQNELCSLESGEGHVTSAPHYQSVRSLSSQLAVIAQESARHHSASRTADHWPTGQTSIRRSVQFVTDVVP